MGATSYTFWLPRKGNSPAEYEDAASAADAAGRYAVADGASESCFARSWAELLVEGFVDQGSGRADGWSEIIPGLQRRWDADVGRRELPWYAQRGVQQGAFATFLGLVLSNSPAAGGEYALEDESREEPAAAVGSAHARAAPVATYGWQAVAVGDACLLHTRGKALLRAFPLEQAKQFNNSPKLVGSRMGLDDLRQRQRLWSDGQGRAGDRLWLMTDALAECCLAAEERGGDPWSKLELLLAMPEREEVFAAWIDKLRETGRLRNDDVTLLAIRL